MTLNNDLEAAVSRVKVDSEIFHDIVHGDPATDIQTEAGKVKTLAKAIGDLEDEYLNTDILTQSQSARDKAIEAKQSAQQAAAKAQDLRDEVKDAVEGSVDTDMIADGAVTLEKLADEAKNQLGGVLTEVSGEFEFKASLDTENFDGPWAQVGLDSYVETGDPNSEMVVQFAGDGKALVFTRHPAILEPWRKMGDVWEKYGSPLEVTGDAYVSMDLIEDGKIIYASSLSRELKIYEGSRLAQRHLTSVYVSLINA